jgi:hypothetical protein
MSREWQRKLDEEIADIREGEGTLEEKTTRYIDRVMKLDMGFEGAGQDRTQSHISGNTQEWKTALKQVQERLGWTDKEWERIQKA